MGKNSIQSNLSKEDIIAEIRLTLAADVEHKKSVVIVEGEDDILFFRGKLQPDVDIRESFSGKCGVIEIVNHFSEYRVIGICDVDFNSRCPSPQIFYYDYSCLEMMLISNDSAFSAFFYTYYQGSPEDPQKVRFQLLSNLKWLSFYRKLSAENNWAVNFKGLSISLAYNNNTQALDTSNLLSQINKINPGIISNDRSRIELLSTECRQELDREAYLSIIQGHDFLNYFQVLCESVRHLKGKSPGVAELSRALICSYRKEDFAKSSLFRSLSEYQATYQLDILS